MLVLGFFFCWIVVLLSSNQSLWGVFPRKGFSHVYPGQKNRCWCLSRQKYCSNVLDHFREGKVSGRKEKLLRKFCIRKSVHSVEKNTLLERKYRKFVTRKEEKNSSRRKNIPRERSYNLRRHFPSDGLRSKRNLGSWEWSTLRYVMTANFTNIIIISLPHHLLGQEKPCGEQARKTEHL